MIEYLYGFVILTALGILYEKYKLKFVPDEELNKQHLINKYLLNDTINLGKKPILWIHTNRKVNARHWNSFYSRNTIKLNQPYIVSCVETIIKHCGNSFNICLIDDSSFEKLIPGWNVNLDRISDPYKSYVRQMAITKILYYFGGFLIPNSTIILKDLKPLYDSALSEHSLFTINGVNRGNSAEYSQLFPMTQIIGCKKQSNVMKEFTLFLEKNLKSDLSDEFNFLGESNKWLYEACLNNKIKVIDSKCLGILDKKSKIVGVDRLMKNSFVEYDSNILYGIYIPSDEILKRTQYQWFARLSQNQIRHCNNVAAKYILLAQA